MTNNTWKKWGDP